MMCCARHVLSLMTALLIAGACAIVPAHADKRVALVIGNSAYKNVNWLDNPKNDAALMAETLRGFGFTLVGDGAQLDLDKSGIDRAVQNFGDLLQGADVGLFYYAGHGVQVRGANYLVPVDANPTRETDVDFQMLDANLVMRQMEGAGTKLNLVILDACRNNPFGGRGLRATGGGLAQMRAPEGTLISFATQPGSVARDGDDGNSPYTRALAQTIRRGGLDIFQTFNEVGLAVKRSTGGEQLPWVSNSPIDGSFYFTGKPAAPPAPASSVAAPAADEIFWLTIKESSIAALFDEFVKQFPASPHVNEARARLDELKKNQVAVVVPPVRPPAPPGDISPKPAVVAPPTALVTPPSSCGSAAAVTVSLSRAAVPLSAGEECSLKPKDTFKECDACPEMVVVPAGAFTMGSPANEPDRGQDEGPQHDVTFKRAFAVGQFAVTFDEWDACVADGGCNGYRPSDGGWGRGMRPVINVSWDDAQRYVEWLSRKSGKTYRLLSEAKLEYATRAGTTTPFWWGSSISTRQANYNGYLTYGNGARGEFRQKTVPVDSFAPNPWGLYQVHGNVWSWTEDCSHTSYSGAPMDGTAWTFGDCSRHVLRGGSWGSVPSVLRSAGRDTLATGIRDVNLGFRVGRTLLTP
jgi:formylglycine-generating enzyme required for sulfatase activity